MSYLQTSPLRPVFGLSLADIQDAVRRDPRLQPRSREDLVSALNTAAAVLERDLAEIPADPELLRRRLAEASPVKRGIKPATWANVRSLVGKAVARIVPTQPSRRTNQLDPAWRALAEAMKTLCKNRVQTSGLMHFCSGLAIPPEVVDQQTFEAFDEALRRSLKKNPAGVYRDTVAAWNLASRTVPGWPKFKAVRPSLRRTWAFPWSDFPLLLASRAVWLQELANPDLVDGPQSRELRPATIKAMDNMLREAASALKLQGWDPATFCEITHFGTLDAFKAVMREMIKQRGGFPGGHIVHVAYMLKSFAVQITKVPPEHLDKMKAIIRRLEKKTKQTGMTPTNEDRLKPFEDPAVVKLFLTASDRMLSNARKLKIGPTPAALVAMAVAHEIELFTLARIGNAFAIDLAKHIIRSPTGRLVWLRIPRGEVKNDVTLAFPLPDQTIALLDIFVRDYRPHLITMPTTALFPGRVNGFRSRNGFGAQLKRTLKKYTGQTINPHLYRHIGAKLYLEDHPGAYEVVRRLLGHTSIDVTTKVYTGTETAAAIRRYQAGIIRRRGPGGVS